LAAGLCCKPNYELDCCGCQPVFSANRETGAYPQKTASILKRRRLFRKDAVFFKKRGRLFRKDPVFSEKTGSFSKRGRLFRKDVLKTGKTAHFRDNGPCPGQTAWFPSKSPQYEGEEDVSWADLEIA
jgi:hypothetical protein